MQDYLHRDRIVVPVTFCLFFLMENHKNNPRIYYVVLFVICLPIKLTDRHDITEILLKVVLNTLKQTKQTKYN
jgi:hypothetical protein